MLPKEKLEQHYNQGRSLSDLAKAFHCSVHTIMYWMKKHGIPRRSRSDAAYIKQNPNGDPFHIETKNFPFLYGLGLGIFWGEGTKASDHLVRVTNADPRIIRSFRNFLYIICGVKKEKIHYSIVAFNDSNLRAVSNYWSKELQTSTDKFGKIVQIPPQGKGSYRSKSQFGVCSITVSNIKLKKWIMEELANINA